MSPRTTTILNENVQAVECPGCEISRPAETGTYFCGNCGIPFAVEDGGDS
ncbi:hypothetical protein [Halostella sp. PRR32]|nr:hypothetical protein [Halostella sp. PRR32]